MDLIYQKLWELKNLESDWYLSIPQTSQGRNNGCNEVKRRKKKLTIRNELAQNWNLKLEKLQNIYKKNLQNEGKK